MNSVFEILLVALIVSYCAISVLTHLAPKLSWRMRAEISFALERQTARRWLVAIGRKLRPPILLGASCGSGGGCNRCGSCDRDNVPSTKFK
jgi:hypothetical protein